MKPGGPSFSRSAFARYGLGVVAVALALLVRLALTASIGPGLPTYITFFPAVMVAALVGGLGPGLVAMAVAVVATDYFVLDPGTLFTTGSLPENVGMLLFCAMSAFISTVVHLYHRARHKAAAYDREQALRETRREKEFLANLMEHASQPFAVGYPDGRLGLFNEAYAKLTGYSGAELRTLNWSVTLTPPEWREREQQTLEELNRTGQPVLYQKEYVRKDGKRVPIEMLVHVARDTDGKPEYYYSFLTDTTARKQAEEALQRERDLLQAIMDGARSSHLVYLDRDFNFIRVNETYARTCGYRPEQMVGKNHFALYPNPENEAIFARVRDSAEPFEIHDRPFEFPDQPGRGVTYWDWTLMPVKDTAGIVTGLVFSLHETTGRKKAEQELRNNEAILLGILNATNESIRLYSPEGHMLMGNTVAFTRLGKLPAEVIGKHLGEILPAELARARLGRLREAVEWVRPVEFEDERRGVSFHHSFYPVVDPQGRVTSVAAFSRDITARKKAEAAVQSSRRLLETAVNYMPAAVSIIRGSDLRLQLVNPAYQAIAPGKVMAGKTLDELWPETGQNFTALCRRVLDTGEPHHVEDELNMIRRRRDGPLEAVYFTWSLHRVRLPGDEGWGILNTVWETTARMRAEAARRESEERLRFTLESIHIGWWELDLANHTAFRSLQHDHIFGYAELRPDWTYERFLEHVLPEDRPTVDEKFRRALDSGCDWNFECRIRRADGQIRWIWAAGRHRAGPPGSPRSMVGIVQDVTERKRAEETLQRTAEELERSNRDLEQFAYVASHDLQEPLRAVAGYVQLLDRRCRANLDEKALHYIAEATEGAARMQKLIHDLLAFSRVSTHGKAFDLTDLETVLDRVLRDFQIRLRESGAQVSRQPLPTLRVDGTQIGQLLQNLIGNALKFRSALPPKIQIGAQKEQGRWRLWVGDNGIGIEPQYFERIFQLFQRLHTRKQYPGTGIGLAICKKIVERHGGHIWVESGAGRGATFYFTIRDGMPEQTQRVDV